MGLNPTGVTKRVIKKNKTRYLSAFLGGRNNKNKKKGFDICVYAIFVVPLHSISSRDGGIGRHEGLKILWPVMAVRVQVPLAVLKEKLKSTQACLKVF